MRCIARNALAFESKTMLYLTMLRPSSGLTYEELMTFDPPVFD